MAFKPSFGGNRGAPARRSAFYLHYAWVIVAIIAVMQMVGTSIRMAFGVFIAPLEQDFGWSQSSIALAYAISSVVTALASPFAGWFGDRFGARRAMVVGTLMFLAGMLLTGAINSIWELYLYFGALLGVAQAIFLVPLIPASMRWFRRHLGIGMGIIMASWGLGPAIAAPLISLLIGELGWQNAFVALGVISAAAMLLLVILFRNKPSDKGLQPYGHIPGDPEELERRQTDPERMKAFNRYMRRTAAYWNMSSIHFLGCVGHAIILVYIVPLAVHKGISPVQAAGILTALSAVSIISRVAVPVMCDSVGAKPVMAIFFALQGVTVIMLFWTQDVWTFYLFAVVFGISYGGETGGFPILLRRYYGQAPTGSPYGFQMLGAGLGMALGGWIGGPVFDIFGNYDWALWASIITSVAGAISILLLEPTDKLLIPDWEDRGDEKNTASAAAPAAPAKTEPSPGPASAD